MEIKKNVLGSGIGLWEKNIISLVIDEKSKVIYHHGKKIYVCVKVSKYPPY